MSSSPGSSSRPRGAIPRSRFAWALAFVLVPVACALWASRPISPPIFSFDTGYHLACGRWIVEHEEVPRADPFCFSTEGLDWVNLNWLSQIGLYKVYSRWGLLGLQMLRLVVMGLTVFFCWLGLRAARAPPIPALLCLIFVAFVLIHARQVRPRLVTFLFVSGFAWALARPDPEERLGPWPALGLTLGLIAINNLHGGFVYCYAMLGADALGTALSSWRRGESKLPLRSRWLIGVILLGLLSFGLHPHGFAALEHAATYIERLGSLVIGITREVGAANFATRLGRILEVGLLFGLIGVLWGRRPKLREVLVTLPFLQLALEMQRGLPLLVLVAAPWAAAGWSGLRLGPRWEALNRALRPTWRTLGPALLGVTLTLAASTVVFHGLPGLPNDVRSGLWHRRTLPVGPAAYLQAVGGEGKVFTSFEFGNTLIWALYPQRRVYLDGRTDLHARGEAVEISNRILERHPDWRQDLESLGVEFVVLPRTFPLGALLNEEKDDWRIAFADEFWVVFQRKKRP